MLGFYNPHCYTEPLLLHSANLVADCRLPPFNSTNPCIGKSSLFLTGLPDAKAHNKLPCITITGTSHGLLYSFTWPVGPWSHLSLWSYYLLWALLGRQEEPWKNLSVLMRPNVKWTEEARQTLVCYWVLFTAKFFKSSFEEYFSEPKSLGDHLWSPCSYLKKYGHFALEKQRFLNISFCALV